MAVDLLVEHRALTSFLGHLSGVLVSTRDPAERIRRLLEPFRHMLMEDFLPPEYREARRGAGVQYLLYRSSAKSASISLSETLGSHQHCAANPRATFISINHSSRLNSGAAATMARKTGPTSSVDMLMRCLDDTLSS